MIYLLFICCLAIYMHATYRLNKVKTHDQVLFPFCQLRREIMGFLYENVFEKPGALSREEYTSMRRLSEALDDAIHNYNDHKTMMFNIRKLEKYLEQYQHIVEQAQPVNLTDNPEIRKFHARFIQCFAKAFLAYTPLIRSELLLRFVAFVYRKQLSQYILAVAKQVHSDKHQVSRLPESNAMA